MSSSDVAPRRRFFRPTAFRLGFAAGLAISLAISLAATAMLVVPPLQRASSALDADLISYGADVSRHGVHTVVFSDAVGSVTQACKDDCDDLRFQARDRGDPFSVRALDAQGGCVVCAADLRGARGPGVSLTRWRLTGDKTLGIKARAVNETGKGPPVETPFTAGPSPEEPIY